MRKSLFVVLAMFCLVNIARATEVKKGEITNFTYRNTAAGFTTDVGSTRRDLVEEDAVGLAKALNNAFESMHLSFNNDYYRKMMPTSMRYEKIRQTFDQLATAGLGVTSPDFMRLCIAIPAMYVEGYRSVGEKRVGVTEPEFRGWTEREAKKDAVVVMMSREQIKAIVESELDADAAKEFESLVNKYATSADMYQDYTVFGAAFYDLGRWMAMKK